MSKFYLHQLLDGKMLVYEDDIIKVEDTGYPLPNCSLPVGAKTYTNQDEIIRLVLGYSIEDSRSFIETIKDIEPMSLLEFKLMCQAQDIGGGCPDKLHEIALLVTEKSVSYNWAVASKILPACYCDEILDEDSDFLSKYSSLLKLHWRFKVNKPNYIFQNNIIMFTGIHEPSDKHIEFIRDLRNIFMSEDVKPRFNYISLIKANNGVGAILLIDSISDNCDMEYFYSHIAGVALEDGKINTEIHDDCVSISFECLDDSLKGYYSNSKVFNGHIKRVSL